jgi:cytochrome-b5 reductase
MSFIRAATLARSAVSRLAIPITPVFIRASQARFFSTEAPAAKKSAASRYLLPVGGALGGYLFYEYYYKGLGEAEQVKPKKVLTSPLDPQNFVDVKLKRVEPYNHNTSK